MTANESRPELQLEAADDYATAVTHSLALAIDADRPRCDHCGHPIWSAVSIALGLGRRCRRTLHRREVGA